ncbi:hypothetical protein, partial [Klebsiella pneumoniae]|uniref:hypothetical protein n=1 Tax=Klebsiella pneumoniae TaxID=573 RepID=UPI001C831ED1
AGIISNCARITLTRIPQHNPTLPLIPNIHSSNIPPNPTTHHSHIFQKVLANAFLLFIRSRSCVLISSIFL